MEEELRNQILELIKEAVQIPEQVNPLDGIALVATQINKSTVLMYEFMPVEKGEKIVEEIVNELSVQ